VRGDSLPKSGFSKKWIFFHILGPYSHPLRWLRGNFAQPSGPTCPSVRPSVGPAKFDDNRCTESPLRCEKPDFWPVSKFNTGSLPLCGNPAGNNVIVQRNYQSVGIGHCYCHYTITPSRWSGSHTGLIGCNPRRLKGLKGMSSHATDTI